MKRNSMFLFCILALFFGCGGPDQKESTTVVVNKPDGNGNNSSGQNGGSSSQGGSEEFNDDMDTSYVLVPDKSKAEIRDGKFYQDGHWVFLKIGKALFQWNDASACQTFINFIPEYKNKGYNVIELNCYWHLFDHDGYSKEKTSVFLIFFNYFSTRVFRRA